MKKTLHILLALSIPGLPLLWTCHATDSVAKSGTRNLPTLAEMKQSVPESLKNEDLVLLCYRDYYAGEFGAGRGVYNDLFVLLAKEQFHAFRGNSEPHTHGFNAHPRVRKYYPELQPGSYWLREGYFRTLSGGRKHGLLQDSPQCLRRDNGDFERTEERGAWPHLHVHVGSTETKVGSFGCSTFRPSDEVRFFATFFQYKRAAGRIAYILVAGA